MDACNSHQLMSFSFLIITTFHPDIDRFYTKSYFCSSLDETEWFPFFEMTWMENEISVAKIFTYCSHLLWTPSGIEYIMASVEYFIRRFACKSCRQSSGTLTLPRRFNDSSKWQGKWPRLSFMLTAVQEHSKLSLYNGHEWKRLLLRLSLFPANSLEYLTHQNVSLRIFTQSSTYTKFSWASQKLYLQYWNWTRRVDVTLSFEFKFFPQIWRGVSEILSFPCFASYPRRTAKRSFFINP